MSANSSGVPVMPCYCYSVFAPAGSGLGVRAEWRRHRRLVSDSGGGTCEEWVSEHARANQIFQVHGMFKSKSYMRNFVIRGVMLAAMAVVGIPRLQHGLVAWGHASTGFTGCRPCVYRTSLIEFWSFGVQDVGVLVHRTSLIEFWSSSVLRQSRAASYASCYYCKTSLIESWSSGVRRQCRAVPSSSCYYCEGGRGG